MTLLAMVVLALTIAQPTDPAAVPAPAGARVIDATRVDGPLELKQADADSEAVLAGHTYLRTLYQRPDNLMPRPFVASYRDALVAAGWKLIAATRVDETMTQPETLTVSAHYMSRGRNVYARITVPPDGPIEVAVADIGAEAWASMLSATCRVRIHSLHFDLDRSTLREYESQPTLDKLADLLKGRNAPAVEIAGHMDNVGEAGITARQLLSEARAKTVAAWLTAHGVPAAKLTAKGYGKTRPIAENDSDLGRALNRRIEVTTGCR